MILTESTSGLTLTSVLDRQRSTDPNSIAKAQKEEFISKNKFDVNNTENISIVYDPVSRTCEITGNVVSNHLVYEDTQEKTNNAPTYYEVKLLFKNVNVEDTEVKTNSDEKNKGETDNNLENENKGSVSQSKSVIIDINKIPCKVRCSCQHYRFYYSEANNKNNFMTGDSFPVYTPSANAQHRPPKNPEKHSGMCKHLIFFITQVLNHEIISDDKNFRIKLVSGGDKWNKYLSEVSSLKIYRPKYVKSQEDIERAERYKINDLLRKTADTITKRRGRERQAAGSDTAAQELTAEDNLKILNNVKLKIDNLAKRDDVKKYADKKIDSLDIDSIVNELKQNKIIPKNDTSIQSFKDLKNFIDKKYNDDSKEFLTKKAEKIASIRKIPENKKKWFINAYINSHRQLNKSKDDFIYITTDNMKRIYKPDNLKGAFKQEIKKQYGLERHRYIRTQALADEGIKSWFSDELSKIKQEYPDSKSDEYKDKIRDLEIERKNKIKDKYKEIENDLRNKAAKKKKSINNYVHKLIHKKTQVNDVNTDVDNTQPSSDQNKNTNNKLKSDKSDETKPEKNYKQIKKNSDTPPDATEEPKDNDNLELSPEDIDKKYNELTKRKKQIDSEFQKLANAYYNDSNEENKKAFEDIKQQKNDLQAEYKKIEKQYNELHKDDNNQPDSDEQGLDDKLKGKNDYEKLEFMSRERLRLEQEFIKYESLINTSKSETVVSQAKISQNEVKNQLTSLNQRYESLNGTGFIKNNYFSRLKKEAEGYSSTEEEEKIESKKANILAKWQPLNKRRIELVAIGNHRELTNEEETEYNDIVDKVSSYEQEYKKLTGTLIKGGYYWNKQIEKNKKPEKKTTVNKSDSGKNKSQKKTDDQGKTQSSSDKKITAQKVTRSKRLPKPKKPKITKTIRKIPNSRGSVSYLNGVPIVPDKPVSGGQTAYNYIQSLVEYKKYLQSALPRVESNINELFTQMNDMKDKESKEYKNIEKQYNDLQSKYDEMETEYNDTAQRIDLDGEELEVDWGQLNLG